MPRYSPWGDGAGSPTQDLANHTSGAQTVTDAIIGVLGASYAGVAATAVFGLEDGSVAGLNAFIEEISASGESAAGLRALVALLRATGLFLGNQRDHG